MATVYLNIGFPKTGTTAIQTFLRENEELLKKQGYCYPDFTQVIDNGTRYRNRNGHFLVYNYGNPRKMDEAVVRERVFQALGKLAQEYAGIILSDESISVAGSRRKAFWPTVVSEFGKIGCRLKVIVYLRSQDQVIQSWWNQRVKSNHFETRNFEKYLEAGEIFVWPLDYYELLNHIRKYVNGQNLMVRVYEKGQFEGPDHSIFSDFLQCAGLTLTEEYTRKSVESNRGLSGNYVEIKRVLNSIPAYREMGDFLKDQISHASNAAAQGRFHADTSMFTYEQRKELMKKYEEGNRKTAEEFLGREDGQLFYEPFTQLPVWKVDQETMYRDMIRFTGEVFCEQQKEIRSLKKEVQQLQKKVKGVQNSVLLRAGRKMEGILKSK